FWSTSRYTSKVGLPFPDTHTYLEVGRNWMQGRGFTTRFNVVYGWSGTLSHPGLAYYNPLGGLLMALVWALLKSPEHFAVAVTVVPCLANAVLLAFIMRRIAGSLPAILVAAGYVLLPSSIENVTAITLEHAVVT